MDPLLDLPPRGSGPSTGRTRWHVACDGLAMRTKTASIERFTRLLLSAGISVQIGCGGGAAGAGGGGGAPVQPPREGGADSARVSHDAGPADSGRRSDGGHPKADAGGGTTVAPVDALKGV